MVLQQQVTRGDGSAAIGYSAVLGHPLHEIITIETIVVVTVADSELTNEARFLRVAESANGLCVCVVRGEDGEEVRRDVVVVVMSELHEGLESKM